MRRIWGFVAVGMMATMAMALFVGRTVPRAVISPGRPPSLLPPKIDPSNIVLAGVTLGVIVLLGAWLRERRLANRNSRSQMSANVDERLERIEHTLEAVALEVERIGEMERFATKLLVSRQTEMERRSPIPPSAPPRVITPH